MADYIAGETGGIWFIKQVDRKTERERAAQDDFQVKMRQAHLATAPERCFDWTEDDVVDLCSSLHRGGHIYSD